MSEGINSARGGSDDDRNDVLLIVVIILLITHNNTNNSMTHHDCYYYYYYYYYYYLLLLLVIVMITIIIVLMMIMPGEVLMMTGMTYSLLPEAAARAARSIGGAPRETSSLEDFKEQGALWRKELGQMQTWLLYSTLSAHSVK